MAPRRKRAFEGDEEVLATALYDAMTVPEFLCYDESLSAPGQPLKIQRQEKLWKALYAQDKSFTFVQTELEKLLVDLAARAGVEKWSRPLDASEVKKWSTSIAKQLRAQGRHLSQALTKARGKRFPPWLARTLGIKSEDPEGQSQPTIGAFLKKAKKKDEKKDNIDPNEYMHTFDSESKLAYRSYPGQRPE